MAASFLDFRRREGLGASTLEETRRALQWMIEALGPDTPVRSVTSEDARTLRDGYQKMDVRKRGSAGPFLERQTENPEHWVGPQTSGKYWRTAQGFFAWLADERHISNDPAAGIRPPRRTDREVATPDPFTNAEVVAILNTPLFSGRRSPGTYLKPGPHIERGDYWWATMLGLHTGMRAGEISQLEVADFDFDAPIPFIYVRREGAAGARAKQVKNKASVRRVPISSVLLKLGLRQFVAMRSRAVGTKRVFAKVALGTKGKVSSGLSHFFSRYWRSTGLWSTGRSTHVFRHTIVEAMRREGAPEDVMTAICGHISRSQTSRYGKSTRPLSELAEAIEKVNYGMDVASLIESQEAVAHLRSARA